MPTGNEQQEVNSDRRIGPASAWAAQRRVMKPIAEADDMEDEDGALEPEPSARPRRIEAPLESLDQKELISILRDYGGTSDPNLEQAAVWQLSGSCLAAVWQVSRLAKLGREGHVAAVPPC